MRIAMIGQKGFEIGERGGGIEQHVRALATHLGRRGHEVTVYARRRYAPVATVSTPDSRRSAGYPGVIVRYVPTVYRKNFEAIVHTFLCTFDALLRDYDVIHYHGVGPSTLAWIPRLLKPKARVVCTFHSQDRFHQKWGLFARLYLWFGEWACCQFPHATIAVSHVIQVYARKHYGCQIVYIPNGAEVQTVTATDRVVALGLEPGRYVLNVGRLAPHKGVQYLIEGWKSLGEGVGWEENYKNQDPNAHFKLVIVGAAGYGSEYEKSLRDAAVGHEDIRFLGYQSGEALRQLYAHAYLFVQPSESEGLPVVVLEAMSFGCPVLVSDIPENLEAMSPMGNSGCREQHVGFSFRNKDASDLAERLGQLLHHPEVVDDAAAKTQRIIAEHFNWNMIAVHTEAVYLSIRH